MRQCRALSCGVLPATCLPHALLAGSIRWQRRITLNASLTARQHGSIICHSAQAASPAPALGTSRTTANGEGCLLQAALSLVLYRPATCQCLTTFHTACADSAALLLEVSGMKCGGCSASVKRILEGQPGVQAAAVNLLTESAVVRVPSTLDLELFGPQAAQALTQKVGCRGRVKLAHSCLLGADPSGRTVCQCTILFSGVALGYPCRQASSGSAAHQVQGALQPHYLQGDCTVRSERKYPCNTVLSVLTCRASPLRCAAQTRAF